MELTATGEFDVIKHIELPDSPVHVTEYRLTVYHDTHGNRYTPNCPELQGPLFGPRLLATMAESYDEVVAAIPHQAQPGSDETSINDNGKKHCRKTTFASCLPKG